MSYVALAFLMTFIGILFFVAYLVVIDISRRIDKIAEQVEALYQDAANKAEHVK